MLLAIDHFLSLSSHGWPLQSTVRLWDIILMEGTSAVFASFLALLELCMSVTDGGDEKCPLLVAPDDDASSSDFMESFKSAVGRMVEGRMDDVIVRTQKYVQLIPANVITELRDITAGSP
jgi:hypothetical protein